MKFITSSGSVKNRLCSIFWYNDIKTKVIFIQNKSWLFAANFKMTVKISTWIKAFTQEIFFFEIDYFFKKKSYAYSLANLDPFYIMQESYQQGAEGEQCFSMRFKRSKKGCWSKFE